MSLILLLDQTIGSSLLHQFFDHHHKNKAINLFNLHPSSYTYNNNKKSREISFMLFYNEYVLIEENLGYGSHGILVYLNNDDGRFENLVTKLVYDPYKKVRCMCLECDSSPHRNDDGIDYLIFIGDDQRMYKYNLMEWIENSKVNKPTQYIWVVGLQYNSHYGDDAFMYPRAVILIESNGKYSGLSEGNLVMVADTDNSRIKIHDSKDGKLLKIITNIGHLALSNRVWTLIYSKELDVFVISHNKNLIKCRMNSSTLDFELITVFSEGLVWYLCYESTGRKVIVPKLYENSILIVDLESVTVDHTYTIRTTLEYTFYDPKYRRFYCGSGGISHILE